MKYIQGVPTCLPTGRDEISWNFACKVDKKLLFTQPDVGPSVSEVQPLGWIWAERIQIRSVI